MLDRRDKFIQHEASERSCGPLVVVGVTVGKKEKCRTKLPGVLALEEGFIDCDVIPLVFVGACAMEQHEEVKSLPRTRFGGHQDSIANGCVQRCTNDRETLHSSNDNFVRSSHGLRRRGRCHRCCRAGCRADRYCENGHGDSRGGQRRS